MSPFVHLHLHSEYSMVDGLLTIDAVVKQAQLYHMPAVAVTDINNIFAAYKLYRKAVKHGVKPVIGCELTIAGSPNSCVVALCMNETGFRNLCKILSKMYEEHPECPRADRAWLTHCGQGLLLLSGAAAGDVGQALAAGNSSLVEQRIDFWQTHFPDRYYLELQYHKPAGGLQNQHIVDTVHLARDIRLPLVATNYVHFLKKEDFLAHEAKVCIARGEILNDCDRKSHYTPEQYFKSTEEMASVFGNIPSALENALEISRRCSLAIDSSRVHLPKYPVQTKLIPRASCCRQLSQSCPCI